MQVKHDGKMYVVIIVKIGDTTDYDGAVVEKLKGAKISWVNMLTPLLHPGAYDAAYSVLNGFAADNGFVYVVSDAANGVVRTWRSDGSDAENRVVRLIELRSDEIHAKAESARAAQEEKEKFEGKVCTEGTDQSG